MQLREVAHARCGDKGDTANIAVIAFDRRDYHGLAGWLTAARVKAHLAEQVRGDVERYELPALGALNFVLHKALGGGVTRSLSLDPHGKSLSSRLLSLEIPAEGWVERPR